MLNESPRNTPSSEDNGDGIETRNQSSKRLRVEINAGADAPPDRAVAPGGHCNHQLEVPIFQMTKLSGKANP